MSKKNFCGRTRREFLWEAGGGFTGLGLAGMLENDGFFAKQAVAADGVTPFKNPLAPRDPHFDPQATSVIFLFMYGGPSQVDTFDYKPKLYGLDGQTIEIKTKGRGGSKNKGRVVGPKWNFKQYGESGAWVSELFPHVATCVDDIAFLKSMTADSPIHGSAMLQMNSGKIQSGSPAMGSWINYGLGSENENPPGFVVMLDPTGGPISGAKNWSSGYMPASYQGTIFRSSGAPIIDLDRREGISKAMQRRMLDSLKEYNDDHFAMRGDNSNLAARIASYELAYKMQMHAPEAVDLARETEKTKELYGINEKRTQNFGKRCLLARRLVERGVRFIQIYAGGAHNDDNWGRSRRPREKPQLPLRPHRQAHRRFAQGPQATRPARENRCHLGRRIWTSAHGRIRKGHRTRSQLVRLHDVDGRWRHQGRPDRRSDRRTGQQRRRRSPPREELARHGATTDGTRS